MQPSDVRELDVGIGVGHLDLGSEVLELAYEILGKNAPKLLEELFALLLFNVNDGDQRLELFVENIAELPPPGGLAESLLVGLWQLLRAEEVGKILVHFFDFVVALLELIVDLVELFQEVADDLVDIN